MPYRALSVAVGQVHTCVVLDDHKVKCWGDGAFGQLGLGDTRVDRGNKTADMGDALPTVDLGAGRTALSLAAGRYNTCALLDDHSVKCWGRLAGLADGIAHGSMPGTMGDHLPALDLGPGRTATSLAAGFSWACALLDDATVKCWGEPATLPVDLVPNTIDLGPHPKIARLTPGGLGVFALYEDGTFSDAFPKGPGRFLAATQRALDVVGSLQGACALLRDDGALLCSNQGSIFNVPSGAKFSDLSMGEQNFFCGLSAGGAVRCWGSGLSGGGGPYWSDATASSETGSPVILGKPAMALARGNGTFHTCALLTDGAVRCWGFAGQEGIADDGGGVTYTAPAAITAPWLGASVEIRTESGVHTFGAWHDIDLGTRR